MSAPSRIAGLDLIRGFAVALVILRHAFPLQVGAAGAVGVVMFFTLSGYLITGILLSDLRRFGRIRYGRFYRNRALRLIPPLLFLLLGYTVLVLLLSPHLRPTLPRDLAVAIAYITDIPGITGSPLLGHLWTLSTEEQFYLIWPPLLALAFMMRRYWPIVLGVMVVIMGAFLIHWTTGRGNGGVLYQAPWSWAVTIVIGAAAQIMLSNFRPRRAIRAVFLSVGMVGVVGLSFMSIDKASILLYALLGPIAAVLTVGLIIVLREWVALPTQVLRPLLALGTVSYAAYLWNEPMTIVASKIPHIGPVLYAVAGIVLTLVMATVSWWLVEKPVARWRARLDARSRAAASPSVDEVSGPGERWEHSPGASPGAGL